jgi:hypothetical protein
LIFNCRIGASGEQTFLKVDESLINAANLSGASVMANSRHILLLPTAGQPDSASFKSLAISRNDGFCRFEKNFQNAEDPKTGHSESKTI